MKLNGERLRNVQPGDIVERVLFGMSPTRLHVTEVTDESIVCGKAEFSRVTGMQIIDGERDSGSYIRPTAQRTA